MWLAKHNINSKFPKMFTNYFKFNFNNNAVLEKTEVALKVYFGD